MPAAEQKKEIEVAGEKPIFSFRVPPETRNGRAKGGYGLWQGASGAHTPQWVYKPRATPPEAITTVRPTGCASFSQRRRCVELPKPRLPGGGQAAAGIGQSPRLAAGKNPRQRARSSVPGA